METEKLESFPRNANPFHYDLYHMGVQIGTNVTVMIENHDTERCEYLIIVNTETGERMRVEIN